jgi:hypothetical protein
MPKFNLQIARTETVVYYFEEVEAESEEKAEEIAWQRYEDQDWDELDTVYGEENMHYVEEIEYENQ